MDVPKVSNALRAALVQYMREGMDDGDLGDYLAGEEQLEGLGGFGTDFLHEKSGGIVGDQIKLAVFVDELDEEDNPTIGHTFNFTFTLTQFSHEDKKYPFGEDE